MKQYKKICKECGSTFMSPGPCAKFCDNCKDAAYKRGKRKFTITLSHDTEEMRKACLNCTNYRCNGACEELARIARGEA